MQDFRKPRARSSTLSFLMLCVALILVLALAAFAVRAAWGMYVKFTVASRGDAAAKQELGLLQNQYTRVSAAVADLSSDRGEEGQIRERFGVAKPGEGTIEIVRNGTSSDAGQDTNKENPFMRIWHALFIW